MTLRWSAKSTPIPVRNWVSVASHLSSTPRQHLTIKNTMSLFCEKVRYWFWNKQINYEFCGCIDSIQYQLFKFHWIHEFYNFIVCYNWHWKEPDANYIMRLRIANMTATDSGVYYCNAQNNFGTFAQVMKLQTRQKVITVKLNSTFQLTIKLLQLFV